MKTAIGVDVGGTNIKAVQVSEEGTVLERRTEPTPSDTGVTAGDVQNVLKKIIEGLIRDDAVGIGFGIAGLIDRKKGMVIKSPNIPAINGFPAQEVFQREFALPVIVENDANMNAYGEKWVGRGKGFHDFAVLTLGTGLGGGIIYRDELFEGHVEVGHMIIEPRGRFCTCGNYGCLESYASGRAIIDRVVSALERGTQSLLTECCDGNFYKVTPELIYRNALEGDNLSREVFRETGHYLGMGMANLVNLFNLEAIIIGGGLIGAWDLFIEEVKEAFSKRAFKPLTQGVEILKTILQEDGGAIGAAGQVFNVMTRSSAASPGNRRLPSS